MPAPTRGRAPQDRLRVVRVAARVPTQQPLAPPGLVFLEGGGQLAGQRPGLERIAIGLACTDVARQLRHCRARQQRGVGQRGIQAPLQAGGIEVVAGLAEVRIQRARHEFARGEEFQVGRHPMLRRQRGLQPAPHRHLRDQHDVRLQQRLARRGRAQFLRQQARQHLERIGVVEAEVGRCGHRPGHCAGADLAGCDPRSGSDRRCRRHAASRAIDACTAYAEARVGLHYCTHQFSL